LKPSILVVNNHCDLFGGAERQISELANYLTNQNYKITIAARSMCPEFKSSLKEARIIETGGDQQLLEFCNKYQHKFDIINAHNHPVELFFSYPLKPVLVWNCNEPPGYVLEGKDLNPQERAYVQRMVKKVVVITDFDRARFKKLYGMDSTVNYPGVRYSYFSEEGKVRNTLNMKNNFVISQIGYWTWTKKQDLTIEIFAKIKKEIPSAKLVLVGYNAWATQYPYVKKVHDKIAELGLEDDVFINDYLTGDDNLRNIYRQSSVFINPTESQGGWATTFEAISAGVPTVISDDFVASNLVKEHKLGKVCSESEEYVKTILDIYSNYDKVKEETKENARWLSKLTWEAFGKRYEKIFEEVLK
jgi:glycosyltransferase involved in cell wall biosynthesis